MSKVTIKDERPTVIISGTGIQGPSGPPGAGIALQGTLASVGELPVAPSNEQDAYIINEDLYIWLNDAWFNSGRFTGPTGATGPQGETGPQGPQGLVGPTGDTGPAGPQGIQGPTGLKGDTGDTGPQGETGPQGIQGPQGLQGEAGPQGIQGIQGETGPVGPEGPQGVKGDQGTGVSIKGTLANTSELPTPPTAPEDAYLIDGDLWVWDGAAWVNAGQIQGPAGEQGLQGPAGPQGIQGVQGETGPQGLQGIQGETGPEGPQGLQGIQGVKGDTGDTGPQGIQGIQGETGPQGIQGVDGDSAYAVAVANGFVGTEVEWIASLEGPEGPQGIQGETGLTGPEGPQGPQGIQGSQGIQGTTGKSVMNPTFTAMGTLTTFTPTSYYPVVLGAGNASLVKVEGHLGTAGTSTTTILLKSSQGATLATLTFASGETTASTTTPYSLLDAAAIGVECTAAGTGAANLVVVARIEQ